MRKVLNVTSLVLAVASVFHALVDGRKFEREEKLSDEFWVGWTVDLEGKLITFTIIGKTTGWIGFGISSDGGMNNADVVIGGVKDGQVYFTDRHASGQREPSIDESQDWHLLEGHETNGHIKLKFSRKFHTCDDQDLPITSDTTYLIWSLGETDDIRLHKSRGQNSVNLLDQINPKFDISRFDTWNITVNTKIPLVETTYWCTVHKSPYTDHVMRHIVGFSAMLGNAESRTYNHHMALHKCTRDPRVGYNYEPQGAECYAGTMKMFDLKYCKTYLYVWAKGGKPSFLPENAGIPLNEFGGVEEYMALEIHYTNPALLENIQFETGITVYTTTETRKHDAAVLMVGHDVSYTMIVPPSSTNFLSVGHCSSNCTKEKIPESGIQFFNVLLHSHLAGRKMKLRRFRDGVELPWISHDDHYDFDYQQNRPLNPEVTILPDDHLTYECTYTNTDLSPPRVTTGGAKTRDEMCIAFILYYPRLPDMDICLSSFSPVEFFRTAGVHQDVEMLGKQNRSDYKQLITDMNWTGELRTGYQEASRFSPHRIICKSYLNLSQIGMQSLETTQYPAIYEEYNLPQMCSGQSIIIPGFSMLVAVLLFLGVQDIVCVWKRLLFKVFEVETRAEKIMKVDLCGGNRVIFQVDILYH